MTMSSAMNAGVMGLTANSTRLAAISDNISNSDTKGYKRSVAEFSNLVVERGAVGYAAGGVETFAFKDVSTVGALSRTSRALDVAIAGRGLLPVTNEAGLSAIAGSRDMMLTPTGSFFEDKDGYLRTQSGHFLMGWPVDAFGSIGKVSRNTGDSLVPINLNSRIFQPDATNNFRLGVNLPADASRIGAPSEPYSVPVEYFDNFGRSQTVTFEFTPNVTLAPASNQWVLRVYDNAGNPSTAVATATINFSNTAASGGRILNATGASYDAGTGQISFTLAHSAVNGVTAFIGRPGEREGISQMAAPFTPTVVTKDGAPIGEITSIEVDEAGNLQAISDRGFRRTMFQIPVADVPNLNALSEVDGQAYKLSGKSGTLYLWDAGEGRVGAVAGYSLMESTTDVASEMTDLIQTQRAYSSNAKIVQTVDEMLQETTNLKR